MTASITITAKLIGIRGDTRGGIVMTMNVVVAATIPVAVFVPSCSWGRIFSLGTNLAVNPSVRIAPNQIRPGSAGVPSRMLGTHAHERLRGRKVSLVHPILLIVSLLLPLPTPVMSVIRYILMVGPTTHTYTTLGVTTTRGGSRRVRRGSTLLSRQRLDTTSTTHTVTVRSVTMRVDAQTEMRRGLLDSKAGRRCAAVATRATVPGRGRGGRPTRLVTGKVTIGRIVTSGGSRGLLTESDQYDRQNCTWALEQGGLLRDEVSHDRPQLVTVMDATIQAHRKDEEAVTNIEVDPTCHGLARPRHDAGGHDQVDAARAPPLAVNTMPLTTSIEITDPEEGVQSLATRQASEKRGKRPGDAAHRIPGRPVARRPIANGDRKQATSPAIVESGHGYEGNRRVTAGRGHRGRVPSERTLTSDDRRGTAIPALTSRCQGRRPFASIPNSTRAAIAHWGPSDVHGATDPPPRHTLPPRPTVLATRASAACYRLQCPAGGVGHVTDGSRRSTAMKVEVTLGRSPRSATGLVQD